MEYISFDYKDLILKIGESTIQYNVTDFNDKSRLYLIFSKACNLCCDYCFQKHDAKNQLNSSCSEEIFLVLNQIIDKYEDVVLFGGEPLLKINYEIIKEMLSKYKYKQFIIFSNGTFDQEYLDLLVDYKDNIKMVILTLDGPREEHDSVRYRLKDGKRVGTYNLIINNVKKLQDCAVNCEIQINCTKNNINKLEDMFHEFSVENLDIPIVLNLVKYTEYGIYHIDLLKEYLRLKNKYDSLNICINSRLIHNLLLMFSEEKISKKRCDVDNTAIVDFSTGSIYKCPQNNKSVIGEIRDNLVHFYPEIEDAFYMKSNYKNEECTECELKNFCYFGCANNKDDYSTCKEEVLTNLTYVFEHFDLLFEVEENYE